MPTQDPTGLSEPNSYYFRNGSNILVPRSIPDVRSDLGVGLQTRQIFYGSSTPATNVNETITIPEWARRYRLRIQGAGSGSNSGIVQSTTSTAVSGGGSGAAGYYLDIEGQVSELTSYGSNQILLSLGAPGAGGAGSTTNIANLGQSGADSTVTVSGTVVFRIKGGTASTAHTAAGANLLSTQGGIAGSNGVVGGTTTGTGGASVNNAHIAASGGSGGGVAANSSLSNFGGNGGRGGGVSRDPVEPGTPRGGTLGGNGSNAVEILVGGIPVPGNGGGGGGSNVGAGASGGNGGNGINGSSGGGGGSCRGGTSGAGGNGGRSFAVVEFFGTAANTIEVVSEVVRPPAGRIAASSDLYADSVNTTTVIHYLPCNGDSVPIWNGTQWAYLAISSGLTTSIAALADGVYDVVCGATGLELIAWASSTARATGLINHAGLLCLDTVNKQTYLGTIRVNGALKVAHNPARRDLWNFYNQLEMLALRIEPSGNWIYNSTTWRPSNNSTANRIEVITGIATQKINLFFNCEITPNASSEGQIGIGINSITTPTPTTRTHASISGEVVCTHFGVASLGATFFQALERTFSGTGANFGSYNERGLKGAWLC